VIDLVPDRDHLNVLCLGAHPDDIEIGCGGTLLGLAQRPRTKVTGLVLTGTNERRKEAEAALPLFFPGATLNVVDLPDGRLPAYWNDVKDALEHVATVCHPTLIFAPRADDAHQDHRLLGRLASTVWRDALILHYEIPKWDGDLTTPSHYVRLSEEQAHQKVHLLETSFPSQANRHWWDEELYLGLMRLRGVEIATRYAEGFIASKVVLGLFKGMTK
jgi:LmbE family N-acetylglucosaminyl deacetylase